MARRGRVNGRVKIQWIMDNTKRKAALRRRLPTLLKKTRELAVLCNVPACVIAYCPGEAQPVVWPSPGAAADVVRKYREKEISKNVLNGTEFLKQMIEKLKVKLSKIQQQNHDAEIELVVVDFLAGRRKSFDDLPADYFPSIRLMVQSKVEAINTRLQELRLAASSPLLPPNPHAPYYVPMIYNSTMVPPRVPAPIVSTPFPHQDVGMMIMERQPPLNDGFTRIFMGCEPRHGI